MNWQLFDAFGIFLGFTANLIVSKIGPLSWRFQAASSFLPTVCLLSLIWVIPESPRWLLKQGRLPEAFAALLALRETPLQAAIELSYATAQIQMEINLLPQKSRDTEVEGQSNGATDDASQQMQGTNNPANQSFETKEDSSQEGTEEAAAEKAAEEYSRLSWKKRLAHTWRKLTNQVDDIELDQFQRRVRSTNYWIRIWQLFRDKRTRRATVAVLVVMISQQLCGV
jgi:Sugar (and other) transporter